jgi:uncharacterized RmlC-like cupin family protein
MSAFVIFDVEIRDPPRPCCCKVARRLHRQPTLEVQRCQQLPNPDWAVSFKAHLHEFHESAFYLLSGEAVELCTGPALEHRETAGAGDYLCIPANVPHVAVNRGAVPAVFIGVRNEPTARESVVMLPELDALVP